MRILLATGIYPPEIGGSAQYAAELKEAFVRRGHDVRVLTYGRLERSLPFGLRHMLIFFRALFRMPWTDLVIALDTVSAGLPALVAAKVLDIPSILRIGGDFLWESFVERTGKPITLPDFYETLQPLSRKERLIASFIRLALRLADTVIFSTTWQMKLWEKPYRLPEGKIRVIENAYEIRPSSAYPHAVGVEKCFLWAGRPITLKNLPLLSTVFEELKKRGIAARLECVTGVPHEELMQKIRESYAVILPSYSDVSPNFILEGIKNGKPFIVTKHTGLADRLKNAGLFVDPLNKNDVLRAVESLCQTGTYDECLSAVRAIAFRHTYDDIAREFLSLVR